MSFAQEIKHFNILTSFSVFSVPFSFILSYWRKRCDMLGQLKGIIMHAKSLDYDNDNGNCNIDELWRMKIKKFPHALRRCLEHTPFHMSGKLNTLTLILIFLMRFTFSFSLCVFFVHLKLLTSIIILFILRLSYYHHQVGVSFFLCLSLCRFCCFKTFPRSRRVNVLTFIYLANSGQMRVYEAVDMVYFVTRSCKCTTSQESQSFSRSCVIFNKSWGATTFWNNTQTGA